MGYFLPFYPPNSPKNQTSKKWKKHLEIQFYISTIPKIMVICYTAPEIWCMRNVIIFHFGPFFAALPLLTAWKMKISKKWKILLDIWSFYTSVPKIMIIWHTVSEIWCMTGAIVIFHFGLFFSLLPPKKSKFKETEKIAWRYHHFTHV